jgi:HEAT repeat protein
VRRYAVRVLAKMHNLRTVEPFLVALKQTDPIVREEALRALRRLGTEEARMALRQYEEQAPRLYSVWKPLVGMRKRLAEMHL